MQASRMFTLLVGLVGPLLSGCATAVPDVERQLAAEVARLNDVDRRLRAELWAEIQATNELLAKVITRLNEIDAQVQERRQAPPAAGPVVPAPEPARAMEQAVEQLRQRTRALEQRLASQEARGHEPRPKGSSQPSAPLATAPSGPGGLIPGMSQGEVLTQLGPPTAAQETPDVVYWFYDAAKSKSVAFDRTTGKVRGWLGW